MCLIFKKNCYILGPETIIAKFNISGDKTIEICKLLNKYLITKTRYSSVLIFLFQLIIFKLENILCFYNVQVISCTL